MMLETSREGERHADTERGRRKSGRATKQPGYTVDTLQLLQLHSALVWPLCCLLSSGRTDRSSTRLNRIDFLFLYWHLLNLTAACCPAVCQRKTCSFELRLPCMGWLKEELKRQERESGELSYQMMHETICPEPQYAVHEWSASRLNWRLQPKAESQSMFWRTEKFHQIMTGISTLLWYL